MRISDWSSDVCSSDLVGIVVGGHETFDLGDPEIFEHLNPQMAIEEGIPARVLVIGCHGRRLYEPNRTHCGEDLGVLLAVLGTRSHDLERNAVRPGPEHAFSPEAKTHNLPCILI